MALLPLEVIFTDGPCPSDRSWTEALVLANFPDHPEFVECCSLSFNNPQLWTILAIHLGPPFFMWNFRSISFEAVSSLLEFLISSIRSVWLVFFWQGCHLRNPTFLTPKTAVGLVSTVCVAQLRSSEHFYQHSEMPQAPLASKDGSLFRQVLKCYETKQYKKGLKAAEVGTKNRFF